MPRSPWQRSHEKKCRDGAVERQRVREAEEAELEEAARKEAERANGAYTLDDINPYDPETQKPIGYIAPSEKSLPVERVPVPMPATAKFEKLKKERRKQELLVIAGGVLLIVGGGVFSLGKSVVTTMWNNQVTVGVDSTYNPDADYTPVDPSTPEDDLTQGTQGYGSVTMETPIWKGEAQNVGSGFIPDDDTADPDDPNTPGQHYVNMLVPDEVGQYTSHWIPVDKACRDSLDEQAVEYIKSERSASYYPVTADYLYGECGK